jgi:outer membrane lipoprotein-sorting protein
MHQIMRHAAACFVLAAAVAPVFAAEMNADEIMSKNFYVAKIKGFSYDATMVLINDKGQQRERKITGVSKLQPDGSDVDLTIRFNMPADVSGTKFLQLQHGDRDDDMWIYLPALKRTRRLVSSNKRDSFVGSDFSYADILPMKPDMFHHTTLKTEPLQGQDCYVIESVPQDENVKRDLGYSKRVSWIRKDNFVEAKVDYYDLNGQLFRTQNVVDFKLVEDSPPRWLALKREMDDLQSGHKTVLTIDKIDIKSAIPPREFSVESLERD